jgi:phosphopantetheinyl transferase (holo-ACP synthase)
MTALIGFCAYVRLDRLDRLDRTAAMAITVLGATERKKWNILCTDKRRLEFLAGRIAAKLAINACRVRAGYPWLHWRGMDISAHQNGAPRCHCSDGLVHHVSISHCRSMAMACALIDNAQVGVDIEDAHSAVRPHPEMFHPAELHQIETSNAARRRWTVKEACGKLSGKGILSYTQDLYIIEYQDRVWAIMPKNFLVPGCRCSIHLHASPCGDRAIVFDQSWF